MNWETICVIIGALGGLEFFKWIFNRKSNSKIVSAKAQSAEVQADADEFHLLRERLELADKQLVEKEQRFYEQTM